MATDPTAAARAFEFVSDQLRGDEDVVLPAVSIDGALAKFVKSPLSPTHPNVLQAAKLGNRSYAVTRLLLVCLQARGAPRNLQA